MDDLIALVRRYQWFDPETGAHNARRNDKEYAAYLGVSQPYISGFYAGHYTAPWKIIVAFLSRFPMACPEMCDVLSRLYGDQPPREAA